MSLRLSFILILLCLNIAAFAQIPIFRWVNPLSSAGAEHVENFVLDSDTAVIGVGMFSNTIDFDLSATTSNLTAFGEQDIFIVEYNLLGGFNWAKHIGTTADENVKSIQKGIDGSLYILGQFQTEMDFDPGPSETKLTPIGGDNTFILKLTNQGNFVWVKQLGFAGAEDLFLDGIDNILIGGKFNNTVDFDPNTGVQNRTSTSTSGDMFVLKLDKNGTFGWVSQINNIGNDDLQPFSLASDESDNVYLAGAFKGNFDANPGAAVNNLMSAGLNDGFIVKLDSDGDYLWSGQIGGAAEDKILNIEVAVNNDLYMTGFFTGSADLNAGTGVFNESGQMMNTTAFLSVISGNANFRYSKIFFGSFSIGKQITFDDLGNIYLLGDFNGIVDFDPGTGVLSMQDGSIFVLQLTAAGNYGWSVKYGYPIGATPTVFESVYGDVKIASDKSIYITGYFAGEVDFDPNPTVNVNVAADGVNDGFFHRLDPPLTCAAITRRIDSLKCSPLVWNGITYSTNGSYTQRFLTINGCDSIVIINLTISAIQQQASITDCKPFLWNGTFLSTTGIYIDTLTASNGCDSIVRLQFTLRPVTSTTTVTSCDPYSFNGNVYNASGSYSVTLVGQRGCDSLAQLILTIVPQPQAFLGPDKLICVGGSVTIQSLGFTNYLWNTGATTNNITTNAPGTFWLRVTDFSGCQSIDTINVTLAPKCFLFEIPNAFTPNGDGNNDFFKPRMDYPVQDYQMEIYQRFGQRVFMTNNQYQGWNGGYKDAQMDTQSFAYLVKFNYQGKNYLYKGNVLLIR